MQNNRFIIQTKKGKTKDAAHIYYYHTFFFVL